MADGIGCFDGRLSNRFIEMIGKQGFKLQSEEPSFGQQGAMLFYDGEKMGNGVFSWKDDSFAQQGSAFGTTDIERIAAFRNQGQGQFIFRSGEGVGQAGTIQIQRDVMRCTDSVQRSEFVCCIQSALFCRMGNVHHARHNHMIPAAILRPVAEVSFHIFGA